MRSKGQCCTRSRCHKPTGSATALTSVALVLCSVCVCQTSVRPFSAFAEFNWKDPLNLDSQLTDEERMVRDTAHTYAQQKLMPRITQANRSGNNTHARIARSSSSPLLPIMMLH